MIADTKYKIKNKNWYPCFADPAIEQEFLQEFNFESLKPGKIALFIIIFVWAGFAWFDLHLDDPVRSSVLYFRFLVVTPLFLIILALSYSKYATRIYQPMALLTMFIIEISIYYIVKFFNFQEIVHSMGFELLLENELGNFFFIFIWYLVILMASMIARINTLQSLLNGLVVIILYILSIIHFHPSFMIVIITVAALSTTLFVMWIGSLSIQQYARQNFRAAKLLAQSMQESESLLLNILPVQIANRLKETPGTIADGFKHVSVLFADIVGFTKLFVKYKPDVIVKMLNQIFSKFDTISKKYGAEKIKTIGDAYMLAAGIPEISHNHSSIVADCALDMIKATKDFSDPDGNPIQIRIGIHTGPAIAGVIGTHKFSYDIWGDTVNTASRMESHGDVGKIQVTKEIFENLKNNFIFEWRSEIEVKGKGKMETFWLIDRREF